MRNTEHQLADTSGAMDVEALLRSLREHGTIDVQEGSFTLSLSEARRKLIQYQSSNPRRYLVMVVAGFQAAGATRITISRNEFRYTLSAPGAFISEEALTQALAGRGNEQEYPGVSDLALGMRLAFKCDCEQIRFTQNCVGKSGYSWELSEQGETNSSGEPSSHISQVLELSFVPTWKRRATGLFQFLGGYVGKNEEIRLVVRHCDRSRIPILLDQEPVHQPLIRSESTVRAIVGPEESSSESDLWIKDFDWEGVVELQKGRLEIVRYGVTYARLEETGLSGVVWHPNLRLDLSRENILCDRTYESFFYELDQVRGRLFDAFTLELSCKPRKVVLQNLHNLVSACVAGNNPSMTRRVSTWMIQQFTRHAPGRVTEDKIELVKLYQELPRAIPRFKPRSLIVLDLCAAALEDRLSGVDALLSNTASLIQNSYPQDYLAAGYLLLGLGACLHNFGQPSIGRGVWQEAMQTVEASGDPRNADLIQAHLKFEVDHMMLEVAKALRIYAASKRQDKTWLSAPKRT
jgi:hypothetical protein